VTVLGFHAVWKQNHWLVILCVAGITTIITALVLYFSPRRRAALVRCLRCGAGGKAHAKVTGDHDQALDSSTTNPIGQPVSSLTAQTAEEAAVKASPSLTLPTARFKSPVPPACTGEEPTAPSVTEERQATPVEPEGLEGEYIGFVKA
jgi:hypothetical protein